MAEFFRRLFLSDFVSHGHCYFWQPSLVWLHTISDSLIALAYFSIPITLYYFIRQRRDIKARGLILMFAAFILACGMTHLLMVWNIWHSAYRLEGVMKAITAFASVATALVIIRLGPVLIKLPSLESVEQVHQQLEARNMELLRHSEAELLASQDQTRAFFEAASQAILGVDASGRISIANRRTEEMFGYSNAELIGQPLEKLLPERFRFNHIEHRRSYFAEPRLRAMGVGLDLAGKRKDGTEFPIEIGLSHANTPKGPLAFGLVSDISERRRAEAALLANEAKLASFFDAASEAIIGVSEHGQIVLVNRRAEEMFGYDRLEMVGQKLEMLLPDRFHSTHVGHRNNYFEEPRMRAMGEGMELAGRRKDGAEFAVEIGLSHVNTPEGQLAFAMVSDVSDLKKAAVELDRANHDLRRSNIEIEQFAHVASHDLQEPLRMVTSYLQIIKRRYDPVLDDDGRQFIDFAVDGAKRMKSLIRDLLDFSRTGTGLVSFRPVPTASILHDVLENLKAAIADAGAQITFDALPTVAADPVLITQVFQNLIANAIKFHKSQPPCIHISARTEGPECIFSVRDNGIGIEERHVERIFKIFERLHSAEEYSGSGIGLAISKRIVERHGGRIWVESQAGVGSTFFFALNAGNPEKM